MSPPKQLARALPHKLRSRPSYVLLLAVPLAVVLYAVPTLYDDYAYPRCGHIILVSAPYHGGEWLSRGAESCAQNDVAPWSGNNITVEEALRHLSSRTLHILPAAFNNHPADLRTFLRHARATHTKVFVLKRLAPEAWGDVPTAEREALGGVDGFKELNRKYFAEVKNLLREVGFRWDELLYDDISDTRLIHGKQNDCYIRNCEY